MVDCGIAGFYAERAGKLTGWDIATLSSTVKRLQIRAKMDLELAERMKELREGFS